MDGSSLLLFALACLALNLIPGPDVIYIVSNTLRGKLSAGLQAALGLGVGYLFHTLAACLGLSAILLSSALAFSVLKWLGAAYLLFLGVQALRAMYRGGGQLVLDQTKAPAKHNVFLQGVLVSVLNPKVALFFLAFLPQFIDSASGSVASQLLILGLVFCGLATICNMLYAALGNWLFSRANSQRYSRTLDGISGVLLIGLASKIVLSER